MEVLQGWEMSRASICIVNTHPLCFGVVAGLIHTDVISWGHNSTPQAFLYTHYSTVAFSQVSCCIAWVCIAITHFPVKTAVQMVCTVISTMWTECLFSGSHQRKRWNGKNKGMGETRKECYTRGEGKKGHSFLKRKKELPLVGFKPIRIHYCTDL